MDSGMGYTYTMHLPAGATYDRFQLQEEIVMGQRVRNYTIETAAVETSEGVTLGVREWSSVVTGSAIGQKRIHVLPKAVTTTIATTLRLRIEHAIAPPHIKMASTHAILTHSVLPGICLRNCL